MHACMQQKGPIPRKLNLRNLSKGISTKIYTLEIYPLYGMLMLSVRSVIASLHHAICRLD